MDDPRDETVTQDVEQSVDAGDLERAPRRVLEHRGTGTDLKLPPEPVDPVVDAVVAEDWGRMPVDEEGTLHGEVGEREAP